MAWKHVFTERERKEAAMGAINERGVIPLRGRTAETAPRDGAPVKADVSALLKDLEHANEFVRYNAARSLGTTGDPAAVPGLTWALKDRNERVRSAAATGLGRLGRKAEDAVPALVEVLKTKPKRDTTRVLLSKIPGMTGVALPSRAQDLRDQEVREQAARALGSIGDPTTVGVLMDALADKGWHVRRGAAWALGRLGTVAASAVPALTQALDGDDGGEPVRLTVAEALGRIRSRGAVPALAKALRTNGSPVLRMVAATAIGEIGPGATAGLQPLTAALKDRDKLVRAAAAEALGKIGQEAREAIPALLDVIKKDEVPSVRDTAAEALRKIGTIQPHPFRT